MCELSDVIYIELHRDGIAYEYQVDDLGIPVARVNWFQYAEEAGPLEFSWPSGWPFRCDGCQCEFVNWDDVRMHLVPEGCPHMDYTENEMDGTGKCNDCGREFEVPPGGWINN